MTSPTRAPDPVLVGRLRTAGCVFAEEEAVLLGEEASSPADLEAMAVRRIAGEPLELVLGWAELCGVRIRLAAGVFVPRQRSAMLIRLALAHLDRRPGAPAVVVDLCCGSGALAAVLARRRPEIEVWASDLDPAAVACARLNLPPERVLLGDLYAALPVGVRGTVDVLLANAPYVPTDQIALMPPEAREHEHLLALDGGQDGLDVQRRVAEHAAAWLRPGGVLLVESGRAQAPVTAALLDAAGLQAEIHEDDEIGATAVLGRL